MPPPSNRLRLRSTVITNNTNVLIDAIPLGTELGKTAAACALIATLASLEPEFSTVYFTPTAKLADEVQLRIEKLLGEGTTFLWTSYHAHDADPVQSEAELGHPIRRRTNKADLPNARIAIVTHRQLYQELLSGVDEGTLTYKGSARTVGFCDENPDLVHQISCSDKQILDLHNRLAAIIPGHPWLPIMSNMIQKMTALARIKGQRMCTVEPLTPDEKDAIRKGPQVNLWDFTNKASSLEVRRRDVAQMEAVLFLLESAAIGDVFYSRQDGRLHASKLLLKTTYPGLILLDATCKLSSTVLLNKRVVCADVPIANYENLQTAYLTLPDELRNASKVKDNLMLEHRYLEFIRKAVIANVAEGEHALVVTFKWLLLRHGLIGYLDPSQPLDWEGRKVNFINYGAGVGLNSFRDIENVFAFGDYYPRRSVTVALVHAWSGQEFSDECLRGAQGVLTLGGLYIPNGLYAAAHEGQILSAFKQLAMRGSARKIDQDGKSYPMRLFTTMDLSRLIPVFAGLFPSAPMPIKAVSPDGLDVGRRQGREGMIDTLMSVNDRWEISAEEMEGIAGIPRSKFAREFQACNPVLEPLGWTLKSAKELGYRGKMKYAYNEGLHKLYLLKHKNPLLNNTL